MHIVVLGVVPIDDLDIIFVRLGLLGPELMVDGLDAHDLLADLRPSRYDDLGPRAGLVLGSRTAHRAIAASDSSTLDETASLRAAGAELLVAVVVTFTSSPGIG